MIKKIKTRNIILSFFLALSLVFSVIILPNVYKPSIAKAEDTYTLGITASDNPSGFGDPYYKNPYWFYGEFSSESILTSGVTFVSEHSNIMVFLQQLYLLVSSYKTELGGTDLTTVVSFTNGSQTVSITFYYAYTATEPSYDSYITSSDGKSIYYHGGTYEAPYVLPYNALYVTDVFFSVYGGMYTLSAATLPSGDDFLESLSALFGDYIPMFQSKGYIDSLNSGGGGGTADFNSGYRAGYGNGYGNGYSIGFEQGVNSIDTSVIINNYLNSESFQQQIEYYKNLGKNDYLNSSEYQQALQDREDLGKIAGRTEGFLEGSKKVENGSFFALISSVIDAPVQTVIGLTNFDILGYNLKEFLLGLLTVIVIVCLIRFFIGFAGS